MRPPRSHAEAQEQRSAEIHEMDREVIREALARVARDFSQPGGETLQPIYDHLMVVWASLEEAEARMVRARAEAAKVADHLSSARRSARAPRAASRD